MEKGKIKGLLVRQAAIAGLVKNLKNSHTGNNLLLFDLELIEQHADATMKVLSDLFDNNGYVLVKKDELIKKAGLIVAEELGVLKDDGGGQ